MKLPSLIFLLAACLTGCSALPSAGPSTSEILEQAAKQKASFDLVEVDPHVIAVLASQDRDGPRLHFEAEGKPPSPTIGRGDKLAISIWQMQPTSDNPAGDTAKPVVIPDQIVGDDGAVSVPYAGRVPASGRTPLQVQNEIDQSLVDKLVHPQSIVTITQPVSNSVTVSGEQVAGARIPLSVEGSRLLDIIAGVGGTKSPIHQTSVRITRADESITIPMSTVISDPRQNIYVWPGDIITIEQTPKTFMALGATLTNNLIPFDADRLELAQAIAKAGGVLDARADPEGVFLFRFESAAVVRSLGIADLANRPGGETPVLYHLNLRQVEGYFLATRFAVADNDLIYAADARLTQMQKFFTLIGTITSPVIGAVVVSRSVGN